MQSKRARLDRFISQHTGIKKKDIRLLLATNRVQVNGMFAKEIGLVIDEFDTILFDGQLLQENQRQYLMLHKPVGVVSATIDTEHKTVIDLLTLPNKEQLHLVGRLDLNTSGLLLLTNDGRWSQQLMSPAYKVDKVYRVQLEKPLTEDYIQAFAEGMYFAYEEITTLPAKLEIIDDYTAMVTLQEGKYHQIKRMFGRFRNRVIALHRVSIGDLILDPALKSGESRFLTIAELALLNQSKVE